MLLSTFKTLDGPWPRSIAYSSRAGGHCWSTPPSQFVGFTSYRRRYASSETRCAPATCTFTSSPRGAWTGISRARRFVPSAARCISSSLHNSSPCCGRTWLPLGRWPRPYETLALALGVERRGRTVIGVRGLAHRLARCGECYAKGIAGDARRRGSGKRNLPRAPRRSLVDLSARRRRSIADACYARRYRRLRLQ